MKRLRVPDVPPPDPTVPDFVLAPELAPIIVLEHALGVLVHALLAEHPTLADDLRRCGDDGTVVDLANTICLRSAALRRTLVAYRRAVRSATVTHTRDDADLPF